uniref:Uncharacterized protein n=1 Tax=Peronospora matthiolae TaxID=2874970 RepID=A0AAV1UF74_9STRA
MKREVATMMTMMMAGLNEGHGAVLLLGEVGPSLPGLEWECFGLWPAQASTHEMGGCHVGHVCGFEQSGQEAELVVTWAGTDVSTLSVQLQRHFHGKTEVKRRRSRHTGDA